MTLDPLEAESMRASRVREDALVSLAHLRSAHLSLLAEHAGLTPRAVRYALVGKLPAYSPERSLLALGLAMEIPKRGIRAFAVTPRGLQVARGVLAARARAAERALKGIRPGGDARARRGRRRY